MYNKKPFTIINPHPFLRIVPFVLACWLAHAQPSLQYVSGDSTAQARVFAADNSGNIFTVFNAVEPSGRPQMRVIKTSAQGTALGTFDFGGSSGDTPSGAATDSQGNLVIAGTTSSTDFPTVSPVVTASDQVVAFVVKINAQLTQILFSTRLGGSSGGSGGGTTGSAVATDAAGNIYVTGNTLATDFPTTPGAFQNTGGAYAFVTEIAAAGNGLIFSTYYGGNLGNCIGGSACIGVSGITSGNAIAVDASGKVVIAGNTSATNLPITAGTPGQTCVCSSNLNSAQTAGFVAEFLPGGSKLAWATYVNTSVGELGSMNVRAVAFDAVGNVIIGGSSPTGLITTTNAIQAADPGGTGYASLGAGFIAKYSANGQQLIFSTYMGAGNFSAAIPGVPGVASLAVDSQGGIWATGSCAPSYLPLPAGSPLLGTNYVVDLSSDGTKLLGGFAVPAGAAGQGLVIASQGEIAALGISGSILTVAVGQTPAIAGIVNSAGFQVSGQVAPYELISLYGNGIGSSMPQSGQVVNGVLGTSLGGVKVTFDGIPAPLLYVGPNQINAVVPGEIAGHATTQLQVTLTNGGTQSRLLFVDLSQPQNFDKAATLQSGQTSINMAIAINLDGSVNSLTNPAPAGSIVAVWATGAGGSYGLANTDGVINGTTALPQPMEPISIVSNGVQTSGGSLEVLYAGDAPDLVTGVIQINFQLPAQDLAALKINSTTEIIRIQMLAGNFTSGVCGIYVR